MPPAARLGGFKILNDVVWITIVHPGILQDFPANLCRVLGKKKINLNFFTCGMGDGAWGMNLVVHPSFAHEVFRCAGNKFSHIKLSAVNGVVLSIFPHKSDPVIASSFLGVLKESGLSDFAIANSYSAISALLKNEAAEKVATSLFKPFEFSAFRTPSDWRLTQKGKEELYKEIVASYQEKKPKVYTLQVEDDLELLDIKLGIDEPGTIKSLLHGINALGISLSFLITLPSITLSQGSMLLCLPQSKKEAYYKILESLPDEMVNSKFSSVSYFTMTGPHFGDRYGIASALLEALNKSGIELLGLSCSIASISGIVPSSQIKKCTETIQACFEVPSLMRLNHN
ncbi:hypothetical protein ACFL2O_02915 [Thermodesulfobacteriota bacterium]